MLNENKNGFDSIMGADELKDFLPVQPAKPVAPAKREFKPWHKPRKQYIRRKQWCQEIGSLLKKIDIQMDNKVFRYLTLPSEDMLDIRVLESALERPDLQLKYFGFFNTTPGSADDVRMNISENEVKGLKRVDDNSEVFRGLLQTAGNQKSGAYLALDRHAPYHAVNIDLCNHFAAPRQRNALACIDALRSIAEVQARKARQGWLFFLTTRIQPDHVDAGHIAAFINAIRDNLARSEEFATKLGAIFEQEGADLIAKFEKCEEMPPEDFRYFFCIGFGKWLLGYLMAAQPQTQVEMLSSYYYSIHGEGQEMLSLAFRCTPRIVLPVDPYGLATAPTPEDDAQVDEVTLGINVAKQSAELMDLDALLAGNTDQMEKMISDSARFLQDAHFDVTDYRDFALKGMAA